MGYPIKFEFGFKFPETLRPVYNAAASDESLTANAAKRIPPLIQSCKSGVFRPKFDKSFGSISGPNAEVKNKRSSFFSLK